MFNIVPVHKFHRVSHPGSDHAGRRRLSAAGSRTITISLAAANSKNGPSSSLARYYGPTGDVRPLAPVSKGFLVNVYV